MLEKEIFSEWEMNYEQLVDYLHNKYGLPKKGYFCKGMNTPNPSIKRTKEGLYIHHIAEDRAQNLSNPKQAKESPAEYQEPQMLVYCNMLEHLILHIKIVEKTQGTFGIFGLGLFIIPSLNEYYTYGESRLQFWENMSYELVKDNYASYIFLIKEYIKIRIEHNHDISLFSLCNELSWDRTGGRIDEFYKKWNNELFYKLSDGTIFSKDCKTLIRWGNQEDTEIVVPENVKEIKKGAFGNCFNLTEIYLPNGIKEIGDEMFQFCRTLKKVNIPDGVIRIGDSAFYGCKSIMEIILPIGLKEIGNNAFKGCKNLKSVVFKDASNWVFGRKCTVDLSKDDLSNTMLAAQYLTKTTKYCDRHWIKKDNI